MKLELEQLEDIKSTITWLLENGSFIDLETSYNSAMNSVNTLDEAINYIRCCKMLCECGKRVLSPITSSELLANWDTAIVDLYRNGGMFVAYDVRLRNCSLHYNDVCNEYYVKYRDVTFGMHDIYNRR